MRTFHAKKQVYIYTVFMLEQTRLMAINEKIDVLLHTSNESKMGEEIMPIMY